MSVLSLSRCMPLLHHVLTEQLDFLGGVQHIALTVVHQHVDLAAAHARMEEQPQLHQLQLRHCWELFR